MKHFIQSWGLIVTRKTNKIENQFMSLKVGF